jgi:hypothetical protein
MAIQFSVSAVDPDLENLLLYLDKLTHLDAYQKIQLVGNAREWLEMSRASTVKAQDFAASVCLRVNGKQIFHEQHCQSLRQDHQPSPVSLAAEG